MRLRCNNGKQMHAHDKVQVQQEKLERLKRFNRFETGNLKIGHYSYGRGNPLWEIMQSPHNISWDDFSGSTKQWIIKTYTSKEYETLPEICCTIYAFARLGVKHAVGIDNLVKAYPALLKLDKTDKHEICFLDLVWSLAVLQKPIQDPEVKEQIKQDADQIIRFWKNKTDLGDDLIIGDEDILRLQTSLLYHKIEVDMRCVSFLDESMNQNFRRENMSVLQDEASTLIEGILSKSKKPYEIKREAHIMNISVDLMVTEKATGQIFVVEIDGPHHQNKTHVDAMAEAILKSQGIRVGRIDYMLLLDHQNKPLSPILKSQMIRVILKSMGLEVPVLGHALFSQRRPISEKAADNAEQSSPVFSPASWKQAG